MLTWNNRERPLVWNGSLGRTPEEIDAYCQVIGDTEASDFCMRSQPNDFTYCFDSVRLQKKRECISAQIEKEVEPSTIPGIIVDWVEGDFSAAISRGEQPSPNVMQKAGALPAEKKSIETVSAEVSQTPPSRYPAGSGSTSTKNLQQQINAQLVARGLCPLKPDGILGPATCGAARAVGITPPSTCSSFTEPKRCGSPSAASISSSSKSSSALPWVLGGAAVLGVGALLIARR